MGQCGWGMFRLRLLESFGRLGIANFACVKINNWHTHAVLELAFAEVMQIGLPMPVLRQVLRNALREKNMPGIPTAHHALRDIDTCTGEIGSVIYVRNL